METKTKFILAGLGVGALLLLGKGASMYGAAIQRYLVQNGPWGNKKLGNSGVTIGHSGCMLTSLTMACNALFGTDWNPDDANDIIKSIQNGFVGAELNLPVAAKAMMSPDGTQAILADEQHRIRAERHATVPQLRAMIDDALSKGGLALVHVDKGVFSGTGEHFILAHAKTDKGYACADPATGKDTFLDNGLHGVASWSKPNDMPYQGVGVAQLLRARFV